MKIDANKVEVKEPKHLAHQERIRLITNEIVKGKSKRWIINHFSEIWELEEKTVGAIYKETVVRLSEDNKIDKE